MLKEQSFKADMMKRTYKNIVINSTILFVIASIIEMTFHELGHFIAAILVHAKDVILYHNYVSYNTDGLSLTKTIFIAAGGPLVSLFIGILFHYMCSKQYSRNLLFLFNLYLSVFGYIGFFGYLIIAPVFTYGDTGYICHALNFPIWLTIAIAAIGVIILYLLMRTLIKYFVEMATEEIAITKKHRIPFINSLILYPLLFGIIITTLLNLPIPTLASLIAPICSPFTIMWTYGNALSQKYPTSKMNQDIKPINSIHYKLLIVFVLTVIVNRLLVGGLTIN
jgi:hypothetical protein